MKCGPWRNDLEVWVNMCAGKLQMLIGSNLSNPRKLNGQCNGVVMMQGNDGKQRRRRKRKVAPIPSTLLFAGHSQKVYSLPRFAIFLSIWKMALHKCTIHLFDKKCWVFVFSSICLFGSSSGSSSLTIPVSEKPRACCGWVGHCTGGGRAI